MLTPLFAKQMQILIVDDGAANLVVYRRSCGRSRTPVMSMHASRKASWKL